MSFAAREGNRPKAERFMYALSIWVFGIMAIYLVANTLWLTAMAICPMQDKVLAAMAKGQTLASVIFTGMTGATFLPIVRLNCTADLRYMHAGMLTCCNDYGFK